MCVGLVSMNPLDPNCVELLSLCKPRDNKLDSKSANTQTELKNIVAIASSAYRIYMYADSTGNPHGIHTSAIIPQLN